MTWLATLALAAFTAGLLGGLHCAAMCGGVACLLNQLSRAERTPRTRVTRWDFAVAYNIGRISSYMAAGMLAGAIGHGGLLLRGSLPAQQVLLAAAGITLCVMALYLAGLAGTAPVMRYLESAGALLWRRVEPAARYVLPVTSVARAGALGVLWGWLPCGMVYAALLLALTTGRAVDGALVMLAFGAGTLPNMLLITGVAGRVQHAFKRRGVRRTAAAVLAVTGVYGIVHALHPTTFAVEGLFCR